MGRLMDALTVIRATSLAAMLLVAAACEGVVRGDGPTSIRPSELVERIASGTAPRILDVRTPEEYAAGHVPGAINIAHDQLPKRLSELGTNVADELVVYCRSGRRAAIAGEVLITAGFTHVRHLEGDILAWQQAGRPIERSEHTIQPTTEGGRSSQSRDASHSEWGTH